MIKVSDLHTYKVVAERHDSYGWHYGTAHLQVVFLDKGPLPYWWCGCLSCGALTLLAHVEVRYGRDCPQCWYSSLTSSNALDFDYGADRLLRSWEVHQEQLTAAYLLGGAEAAQAIGTELHQQYKAAIAKERARLEATRAQRQP